VGPVARLHPRARDGSPVADHRAPHCHPLTMLCAQYSSCRVGSGRQDPSSSLSGFFQQNASSSPRAPWVWVSARPLGPVPWHVGCEPLAINLCRSFSLPSFWAPGALVSAATAAMNSSGSTTVVPHLRACWAPTACLGVFACDSRVGSVIPPNTWVTGGSTIARRRLAPPWTRLKPWAGLQPPPCAVRRPPLCSLLTLLRISARESKPGRLCAGMTSSDHGAPLCCPCAPLWYARLSAIRVGGIKERLWPLDPNGRPRLAQPCPFACV
jgi:hypothetical protein